jgi:multiple sugar transport system permease protein
MVEHVGADRLMIGPVVIIASVLQKHIARGLLVGAVKG